MVPVISVYGRRNYGTEYTLMMPIELAELSIGGDWCHRQLEDKEIVSSFNKATKKCDEPDSLLAEIMKTTCV